MANQPDRPVFRVLVADAISPLGVEALEQSPGFEVTVRTGMSPEEFREALKGQDGLIVRSATRPDATAIEAADRLKVIGRAGSGVDNIDLEAATRAGIVVMNTPGGNSVAAAELTVAHLLAMARNVVPSNADLRAGKWERKKYMGQEVAGKTLGLVGLGRIGREVARIAKGLRMEVIGYDPYVSAEHGETLGIEVLSLEDVLARADVVSLHVPKNKDTHHLINAKSIATMKKGALLINCARGGLIDESALLDALDSGHIGGAAVDVYETEPPTDFRLVEHPRVVATPHLGASTREAQVRVGVEIAEKVRDYLVEGVILDAVNLPSMDRETSKKTAPAMELAERSARFLAQVADGGIQRIELQTFGELAELTLKPLVMSAVRGLLTPILTTPVSLVNALPLAAERGITIEESRSSEPTTRAGLLRLTLHTDRGSIALAGTLTSPDAAPRLVEIDGVPIEANPEGHLLYVRNQDRPGVFGQIAMILGRNDVNIGGIQLGRGGDRRGAVAILQVDSPIPTAALEEIQAVEEIRTAMPVTV
ncbi:MAG: phosphoglycerate dehydrogenase [Acidobacteriota bacterium]|nr:phosphoglycerate dehydrogenase [Acidobacteriota bacterium]